VNNRLPSNQGKRPARCLVNPASDHLAEARMAFWMAGMVSNDVTFRNIFDGNDRARHLRRPALLLVVPWSDWPFAGNLASVQAILK
jgi:hypothetical protein